MPATAAAFARSLLETAGPILVDAHAGAHRVGSLHLGVGTRHLHCRKGQPVEQLDLLGGSVPVGPPTVPPVTFHERTQRRSLRGEKPTQCGHCVMNIDRFRAGDEVPGWVDAADVTVLKAVALVTQRDGSTLKLCGQHAQEHTERGI